jgi:hypothetical protein
MSADPFGTISPWYTPNQHYGFDWQKAIEGYKWIDFRPYKSGETILTLPGKVITVDHDGPEYIPYLILRKKKPRRWTFEECSKEEASAGEGFYWVRSECGCFYQEANVLDAGYCFVRPVEAD